MGPTWVLSALEGPHVGPMNIAIRVMLTWDVPAEQGQVTGYSTEMGGENQILNS